MPVTHEGAAKWLDEFLDQRFSSFGDYEDSISQREPFLFHSILTPMLNIGLLTPEQIVNQVMARSDDVPINSLEGFEYAYCHQIERLMVLGNFMLLCDIAPNAVYQWFMELFIDAYDWVMVPNVYGMRQHADGGLS